MTLDCRTLPSILVVFFSVLICCSGAKNSKHNRGDVVNLRKNKNALVANGVKGFKSKGKFFKIMGSRGLQRLAFQKFEEERDFAQNLNSQKSSKEETLIEEEESYMKYKEQRAIAREKGEDVSTIEEPQKAKLFEKLYSVDSTAKSKSKDKKRKRKRKKKKRKRNKRFAVNDEKRYWEKGIVPYVFTFQIKAEDIPGKMRAMSRYAYWTCIRFVPWTKNTSTEYGLDHDNYLRHVSENGCWSVLGNTKGNGQKISCCMDGACVHELGHSLGLQHEQKSPLHDDYMRINPENILKDKIGEYQQEEPSNSRTFGYYDLGSQMHYKSFMFSKNSKPTMTLFDPAMEFMLLSSDTLNFYMFKEVSTLYHCDDLYCAHFNMDCGKDGYVAYIRGKCQCRCPDGYDPEKLCREKYRGDKLSWDMSWPTEGVSLLKPIDGCPQGFSEGIIKQFVPGTAISDTYHIDSENSPTEFTHKFCTKFQTEESKFSAKWGEGQYCILRYGGVCPKGFTNGVVGFDNIKSPKVISKPIPDSKTSKDLVFHFCCRDDGSWKDPLLLPIKDPLVLFQKGDECQEIKDMSGISEWFKIQNHYHGRELINGSTPEIEVVGGSEFYIGVCYYWPINYDCGGLYELSDSNPTVTITSPNYPSNYNPKQHCHWLIKSPEGTHMKLNFKTFNVDLRADDSCGDALEIRTGLPGQPGINYCGDAFEPTISSERNFLGLVLTSGPDKTRKGFEANITFIKEADMCYTGKGYDYMGQTNVTQTFRACQPWSEVQHCPHHLFSPKNLDDGLKENYCRNPGSGLRPWCYTQKEGCLRDYCDVCHLNHCFDKYLDCYALQQESKVFCQNDPSAKFGCRKSCGFCEKERAKSVSSVLCPAPEDFPDARTDALQEKYKVGDNVTFKCKTGSEIQIRVCLSDGTWSGGGFVCGRCPIGWVPFHKKCYRFFEVMENKKGAEAVCKHHDAVVAPAKDADELNFLLSIRNDVSLFWLGMKRPSRRRPFMWQEDDTRVTWSKFRRGSRSDCAFVDKNGLWVGASCKAARYMAVICKYTPSERRICADVRNDCSDLLEHEASACIDYPDFAWHVCPLSCGVCHEGPAIQCSRPDDVENAVELSKAKIVNIGKLFEYQCQNGFTLNGGNLRRVCLNSGVLSGSSPKCVPEDSISTPNNAIELLQRMRDGNDGTAYVGLDDAQRIHKNGRIKRWKFYSIYDGEVSLQVWRKSMTVGSYIKLKLIGQTVVPSTKDHRVRTIDLIPTSRQIEVRKGDYIGFFLPVRNKGGVTFDKCLSDHDGQYHGHQYSAFGKQVSSWSVGKVYKFRKDRIQCKIVSLKVYVQ